MNLFVHYSLSQSLILQFLFLISSYDKELLLSYIKDLCTNSFTPIDRLFLLLGKEALSGYM